MIAEVYVNKEIIPLLLKAKCPLEKVIKQNLNPVYYTKDFNDECWQDCDAYYIPTQAQVMKWLREVHKIDICAFPCHYDYNTYGYNCKIYVKKSLYLTLTEYKICENACNDAIEYCLKNLI